MFNWIEASRLFHLTRTAKRLTPWWAILPLGAGMLLLAAIVGALLFLVIGIAFEWSGSDAMSSVLLVGFEQTLLLTLAFGSVIFLVWLWVRFYEQRPFFTLGFERAGALLRYGRGLLVGLGMFASVFLLLALTGSVSLTGNILSQGLIVLVGVLVVFVGWIVQGAAEEILVRGWMMSVLGVRYTPALGIFLSALFFTVMHGLNPNLSVLALVNLFLYALFASLYALREGSLWGICAFHSVWNWSQGNIFGFAVSGSEMAGVTLLDLTMHGPDWLTGGAFGPEGGVAVTLVLVAGIAVILLNFQ
jgi:membrane protease YdiL (CAAX protease family)